MAVNSMNVVTQVDRLFEGVKTPKYIGWKFYPRPKGRGYSPDLQVGDYKKTNKKPKGFSPLHTAAVNLT